MVDTTAIRALFTTQVLRDFEQHLSTRTRRVFEHDGHPFNSLKGLVVTFVEASPSAGQEPSRFDLTVSYDPKTATYKGVTQYEPSEGASKTVAFEDLDAPSVIQPRVVLGWVGRLREAYECALPGLLAELDRLLR